MRVVAAAVQSEPVFGDVVGNLDRIVALVGEVGEDLDLIVVPELASTGYDLDRADELLALAEPLDGPTVATAQGLATARDATVVFGLVERGRDGAVYDTAVAVDPDASVVPYRKTHLYPPETALFTSGDRLLTVASGAVNLGLLICFEHAFPEVATTLALQGAQILAIPSAVPKGYEHLLHLRSRARAQDNQVFVVAANMAGGEFVGRSLIVDPRGDVLAEADGTETVLVAELDLDAITDERTREPSLRVRRPELYR